MGNKEVAERFKDLTSSKKELEEKYVGEFWEGMSIKPFKYKFRKGGKKK